MCAHVQSMRSDFSARRVRRKSQGEREVGVEAIYIYTTAVLVRPAMQTSKLLVERRYAATCRRMLHGQTLQQTAIDTAGGGAIRYLTIC